MNSFMPDSRPGGERERARDKERKGKKGKARAKTLNLAPLTTRPYFSGVASGEIELFRGMPTGKKGS